MIERPWATTWVVPNWRCTAVHRDGREERWVTHGTEESIRLRLSGLGMDVVQLVPFDFGSWRRRSEQLVARAIADRDGGEEIVFAERQWQLLKRHLFELFGERCAYCEAPVRVSSHGEVEHFRPKRPVRGVDGHPGYWWLCYEPSNLLPACSACNGGAAKSNRFPVEGARWAVDPTGLASERPLLLNPYVDEIDPHLRFEHDGTVTPITERGAASEQTYRLNRAELVGERQNAYEALTEKIESAIARVASGERPDALIDLRQSLTSGRFGYAKAMLACLARDLDRWRANLAAV